MLWMVRERILQGLSRGSKREVKSQFQLKQSTGSSYNQKVWK